MQLEDLQSATAEAETKMAVDALFQLKQIG
jgi:hypothetical protein